MLASTLRLDLAAEHAVMICRDAAHSVDQCGRRLNGYVATRFWRCKRLEERCTSSTHCDESKHCSSLSWATSWLLECTDHLLAPARAVGVRKLVAQSNAIWVERTDRCDHLAARDLHLLGGPLALLRTRRGQRAVAVGSRVRRDSRGGR